MFAWSIPGWVLLLVATAVCELIRHRRRRTRRTPLATVYVDEFTAMLYGTKRLELDHRDSTSMLREEDARGRRHGVDLDGGVAYLTGPEDTR